MAATIIVTSRATALSPATPHFLAKRVLLPIAKRASYLEAVERLTETMTPEYGPHHPVWTEDIGEPISHQYATPHVPVQPLSTVS